MVKLVQVKDRRGAGYLTGGNLKVVCAEFSTLGYGVLLHKYESACLCVAVSPRIGNSVIDLSWKQKHRHYFGKGALRDHDI